MSLQLFAHPFSSYCQKVLIPLWADGTEFEYRMLDEEHPDNMAELERHWPFRLFPLLLDDGRPVVETTLHHRASAGAPSRPQPLDPRRRDGPAGALPRPLLRPICHEQHDAVRCSTRSGPKEQRDPYGVEKAMERLRTAYDWLEANLGDGPWAVGEQFTLADCAAAPSLFYADWVEEIGPIAAEAGRLSRAAAGPSGRRAGGRRGAALSAIFSHWARPTGTSRPDRRRRGRFPPGRDPQAGIELAIVLPLCGLESLEGLERLPMVGGEIDAVSVSPQLGTDKAGRGRKQPRPVAVRTISGHELRLPFGQHLELPEPNMGHANARATLSV